MERTSNEDDLEELLLPTWQQSEDPLQDPLARTGTSNIFSVRELPGNLVEYLDLRNPLPTDRKFREIMSGAELALADQVRRNDVLQRGGVTYCAAILLYTFTIAGIEWINPEIRLGYLLLAPLPLYVPFILRWWWEKEQRARHISVSPTGSIQAL